jgi:hypothetical protein
VDKDGLDKKHIAILREGFQLEDFITAKEERGELTAQESELIAAAGREVLIRAGLLDRNRRIIAGIAVEHIPILRHSDHVEKRKLLELHPECKDELEQHIQLRKRLPLPPVPSHLVKPGAAYRDYRAVKDFIDRKWKEGVLTRDQADDIRAPGFEVFHDVGVIEVTRRVDPAALALASQLIKEKLLELHPELADEVRNLGASRSR